MTFDNIAAIAWDLDGTLLDSYGIYKQILSEVADEHGHQLPSDEVIMKNFHGHLDASIKASLGLETDEEVAKAYERFLERQEGHYDNDIEAHLFNDAIQLAQQAAEQGIPQIIVTNRYHEGRGSASPRAIVAATALADCINEIRCGDEVEFGKPDARSIGDWVEELKIPSEQLLVIGDQHVDAELAVNLGARALLVGRNGDIPHLRKFEPGQGTVVESLHDIIVSKPE